MAGHQVELALNVRIVCLPAEDLDRHEDGRKRVTYLVDHFAGVEAGWEGAEGHIRRIEKRHGRKGCGVKRAREFPLMQCARLPFFRYAYRRAR
jgi:hypothetical protein